MFEKFEKFRQEKLGSIEFLVMVYLGMGALSFFFGVLVKNGLIVI